VINTAQWIAELHPVCAATFDIESHPAKRTLIASEFACDVWKVTRPFVKATVHFVAFHKLLRDGQSQDSAELAAQQGHLINSLGKAYRAAGLHVYFH
jgi:hypothetical protein